MPQRELQVLAEWTDHCRALDHAECQHLGSAGTIGLHGAVAYVTLCTCGCHKGCVANGLDPDEMKSVCDCWDTREARQHEADAAGIKPPQSLLARLFNRPKR
jgi:hypothetical protein